MTKTCGEDNCRRLKFLFPARLICFKALTRLLDLSAFLYEESSDPPLQSSPPRLHTNVRRLSSVILKIHYIICDRTFALYMLLLTTSMRSNAISKVIAKLINIAVKHIKVFRVFNQLH